MVDRRIPNAPAALALAAGLGLWTQAAATDRITPPNRRVPRYVSLAYDEVYARTNPGREERLKWIYHAKGLPVQVVAEVPDWRRVCDPEGHLSWIATRNLTPQRTVMNLSARALPLRRRPEPAAPIVANMVPRAIGRLLDCQPAWCRIRVGATQGWLPIEAVWGTRPAPQCGLAFPSPLKGSSAP